MTLLDITENKTKIYECAKCFRQDANSLMEKLAEAFNFDLAASELIPRQVYNHKHNNKGLIENDWTFFFHGAECKFENLQTGQIVELIYTSKPEFGFLDGFFFYNYMVTTYNFKQLADWFVNYLNVWTAIETLADQGVLTRISSVTMTRNILAL